eukprot:gene6740-9469_t
MEKVHDIARSQFSKFNLERDFNRLLDEQARAASRSLAPQNLNDNRHTQSFDVALRDLPGNNIPSTETDCNQQVRRTLTAIPASKFRKQSFRFVEPVEDKYQLVAPTGSVPINDEEDIPENKHPSGRPILTPPYTVRPVTPKLRVTLKGVTSVVSSSSTPDPPPKRSKVSS